MDQGDRLEDIMHRIALVILAAMATFSLGPVTSAQAPDPKTGPVIEDVWQPARTPKGRRLVESARGDRGDHPARR